MKIVFTFSGEPQTTGSVHAYSTCRIDQPSEWCGSRCEVLIVDCIDWKSEELRREGDALYIEGNTASVKKALRSALRLLESAEKFEREQTEKYISEEAQCPVCGYWVHPRSEWHADGHGNRCGTPESAKAIAEKGRIRRRVESPPSADAVDPQASSTGKLPTRDRGIS